MPIPAPSNPKPGPSSRYNPPRMTRPDSLKLHIGCGQVSLPGWINIDNQPYPGVDHVIDVAKGLPFNDADFVFAEHFIEHLPIDAAVGFLRECRRVLKRNGVLRLSTPNLDWVFLTHYRVNNWNSDQEAVDDCFTLNRAFHAWGHHFLYNAQTLSAVLRKSGFGTMRFEKYGESSHEELQGLERHEKWIETPELPHVLVVEASGYHVDEQPELEAKYNDYVMNVSVR